MTKGKDDMGSAYAQLEKNFHQIGVLGEAASMLQWDMSAMMPSGGATARAEQMATLATLRHQMMTDPKMSELLNEAASEDGLSDWQQANLREMKREHLHATALDSDLVEALSRASSHCEQVWRKARPAGDFAMIAPALKEVLNLSRKAATAKAEKMGCSRYDALLDQYEPGGKSADIDPIFEKLEAFLPDFLQEVLEFQNRREIAVPEGPFAISCQEKLGRRMMETVGFDFDHGRLDVSLHPFCGGTPDDVRLTTRYDESDFTSALMGVMHETGHALYERGLPTDWRNQPVGTARGMSVHESQSLLVEMQVCRSVPFLTFAQPLMKEAFGGEGEAWSLENFVNLYHQVKPGFIRVDADEVTYPAHVILRYKLERALIEEQMEIEDIPANWNAMMKSMLGIVPENDREGCLQDIHWYDGAWGYFPTYTLGAMTAAQIYDAAKKDRSGLENEISQGRFVTLLDWLRENVHSQGSKLATDDLLMQSTGKKLDPDVFISHLKNRYLTDHA